MNNSWMIEEYDESYAESLREYREQGALAKVSLPPPPSTLPKGCKRTEHS